MRARDGVLDFEDTRGQKIVALASWPWLRVRSGLVLVSALTYWPLITCNADVGPNIIKLRCLMKQIN